MAQRTSHDGFLHWFDWRRPTRLGCLWWEMQECEKQGWYFSLSLCLSCAMATVVSMAMFVAMAMVLIVASLCSSLGTPVALCTSQTPKSFKKHRPSQNKGKKKKKKKESGGNVQNTTKILETGNMNNSILDNTCDGFNPKMETSQN